LGELLGFVLDLMVLALRVSAAVLLFYVVLTPVAIWRWDVGVSTAMIAAAMQVVGYGLLTLLVVRVWKMIRGTT
jgi:hypothetical protein